MHGHMNVKSQDIFRRHVQFTVQIFSWLNLTFRSSSVPLSLSNNYAKFLCGGEVGLDIELQAAKSRVEFPVELLEFFIDFILPATL
jgi:hypothetical protein